MDEEAGRQLTGSTQQLDGGGSRPSSPSGHQQQRRSLASILSIKREPRRPKTPSVVVTDETTHLVSEMPSVRSPVVSRIRISPRLPLEQSELTSIPAGRLAGKSKLSVRSSSCGGVVNGGTLESIVALDSEPAATAPVANNSAGNDGEPVENKAHYASIINTRGDSIISSYRPGPRRSSAGMIVDCEWRRRVGRSGASAAF